MSTTRVGRPAERQDWIVQELRQQIVRGLMSPGDRLPTRDELGVTFGVSAMTIQRALDRLKSDGFVQVNGRNGTCVAPEPPHLTRYGIVFPQLPEEPGWTRYFTALTREAQRAERTGRHRLPRYHTWESDDAPSGYQNYDQLFDDIRAHRLAGVILAAWPPVHGLQEVLAASSIPRVVLGSPKNLDLSCIDLDNASFWTKALDHLRDRGCRRIACLASMTRNDIREPFLAQVAERGLITQPYWWQVAHPHAPEAAHYIMHLMLHANQIERPDGLIVADDNFVEAATSGLLSAGRVVPGDLEVVAHCNFPYPTPAVVPVQRLGYDSRAVIAASIASIDAQRRGEGRAQTCLPAVFENELAPD